MKYLAAILFTLISVTFVLGSPKMGNLPGHSAKKQMVINGWHNATVESFNNTTFTKQTYSLKVKVVEGTVTAIDFGSGSIVHSGINNDGYTYSGGDVKMQSTKDGSESSGITTVVIKDEAGTGEFQIKL